MNQKNRSWYICGFADGEGSFNLSWRKRDDFLIGWRVAPVFNISQKDYTILPLIQEHLACGTIRFRKDGVWVYEVDNLPLLDKIIIPFFKKHPFLSEKKRRDFARFQEIMKIISQGNKSKTYGDLEKLLELVSSVEAKHARKYTDQEILERAQDFWVKNKEKISARNQRYTKRGTRNKKGAERSDAIRSV